MIFTKGIRAGASRNSAEKREAEMDELNLNECTPKTTFRRVGLALFITAAVMVGLQFLAGLLQGTLRHFAPGGIVDSDWFIWAAAYIPIYIFGIPAGILLLRKLPADKAEKSSLGFGRFCVYLLICIFLMYAGNLIGTLLSALLSGGNAENGVVDIAFNSSPLKILVSVILAPILEEFLFRKQIIDRCARFGEKTAILFSALVFGLFHMNLFQFFYAFLLGLVFAYIYTRTRRLHYTVILHMIINFCGVVLAPLLITGVDESLLDSFSAEAVLGMDLSALLPYLALALYGLLTVSLSIAGLVLLIINVKTVEFSPAPEELPRGGGVRFKTVYCNLWTGLFALICLIMFVLALFL